MAFGYGTDLDLFDDSNVQDGELLDVMKLLLNGFIKSALTKVTDEALAPCALMSICLLSYTFVKAIKQVSNSLYDQTANITRISRMLYLPLNKLRKKILLTR